MSRVGLISETGSTRYLVIGYLRKDIVRIHNIRNYYSIILMDIRRVKPDKDCYTLAVPLSILPGLNADQSRSGILVIVFIELCERLTSGVSYIAC